MNHFSPNNPPRLWAIEPKAKFPKGTEIKRNHVSDGDEVPERTITGSNMKVEVDYGYYDDTPSYYVVEYASTELVNPNYESELKSYKDAVQKYEKDKEEWDILQAEWEAKQEKKKIADEKRLLLQLKKKYE